MQLDSTQLERFFKHVNKTDGCWLWTGTKSDKGYGIFYLNGKRARAHRLAYESIIQEVPNGFQLDHLCRNPSCVNPSHLEIVTSRENTIRGQQFRVRIGQSKHGKLKQFCKHGHPLSGDNLYIPPGGGYRSCRACRNARNAKNLSDPIFRAKFSAYQKSWRERTGRTNKGKNKQKRIDFLLRELRSLGFSGEI
jgi:hypothetical protein